MDHCHALRASINGVAATWKRPRGRPQQHTWIRTVKVTYNLPTLVYTLHGVEHRTDLTGEHLLAQLRSSRGVPEP